MTEFEKAVKMAFSQMKGYDVNDEGVKVYAQELLKAAYKELIKSSFVFEYEHNIACILASECLRNHGWFARERSFNDLWRFVSTQKELFNGEFNDIGKVKIAVLNNIEL